MDQLWPPIFLPRLINSFLNPNPTTNYGSIHDYIDQQCQNNDEDEVAVIVDDQYDRNVFVKQKYDWDCGIAAVLMILRIKSKQMHLNVLAASHSGDISNDNVCEDLSRGIGDESHGSSHPGDNVARYKHGIDSSFNLSTLQELLDLGNPLWTIDLFLALIDAGLRDVEMYTKCIGVSHIHGSLDWYEDHLSEDTPRVLKKFNAAKEKGYRINEDALLLDDLLVRLRKVRPDATNFSIGPIATEALFSSGRDSLEQTLVSNQLKRFAIALALVDGGILFNRGITRYTGHFIVILGYNPASKSILFHDPAGEPGLKSTSFEQFASAWSAPGTDQDIVLIY